jgi:Concanavalin A-like lectin/glucanases superfamily
MLVGLRIRQVAERFEKRRHGGIVGFPSAGVNPSDASRIVPPHRLAPEVPIGYDAGVFGQGIRLNDSAWVAWSVGALQQGTVEFWAKLDSLTNSSMAGGVSSNGGDDIFLMQSYYSDPFFAGTFYMSVFGPAGYVFNGLNENKARGGVNIEPFNWNDTGATSNELPASALITSGKWFHYALTWGNSGLHLYVNGILVYSNSNTGGQNPSTSIWHIGNNNGLGFNGVMDELRISNIQRTFAPFVPQVNIVPYSDPFISLLQVGWQTRFPQAYQIQTSTNMLNWASVGNRPDQGQMKTNNTYGSRLGKLSGNLSSLSTTVGDGSRLFRR